MTYLVALHAVWEREIRRALRDRGQLIGGLSRPLLWVLILGIGFNPYFRAEVFGQVRFAVPFTYLQFIFPAVIVLNIMYTAVQSAVSLIADREFGFMREILVAPVPRWIILLGKILGGATVALGHGCLVLILAQFAGVQLVWSSLFVGLLSMFALAFALTCVGIFLANRIRSFEGFGVFSNAVILPLYFTSSSVFPLDPSLGSAQTRVVYPEWLVIIIENNPLTYVVDHFRGVFINYNQFDPSLGPMMIAIIAGLFFVISLIEFRRG